MITLQELVARAKLAISNSPKCGEVFYLINGKLTAKEIAIKTNRAHSNVANDIEKLRDFGLIEPALDKNNEEVRKNGSAVYQKNPLLKHLSKSYFKGSKKVPYKKAPRGKAKRLASNNTIRVPTSNDILEICKSGENQIYEFKEPDVEARKISKEIAGFANTQQGGTILYGVDDDGTIVGSDKSAQSLDQPIMNAVRTNVKPSLTVKITSREVLGYEVVVISIPPRNPKKVYQFQDKPVIRKGTNVFSIPDEELATLYAGKHVV